MDTNNIPLSDIKTMFNDLTESIRHNVSLKLMDTSEKNPLSVYIPLEHDAVGLSTLSMPTVTEIYQQPSEGIIYVKFEFDYIPTDWDILTTQDQIQILEYLEEN